VDGKLWRVLRDLAEIHLTSQGDRDLSEAFPLGAGVGQGDPLSLLFDIFIDDLVDCMIRALSMALCMGQTDGSKFVIC
jgi:hypothetical protein